MDQNQNGSQELGMTVEEIKIYQKENPMKVQVYGKYGTLAKMYLEEHYLAKLWELKELLPEYLHNIDLEADQIHQTLYKQMSESKEFKKTGNYIQDLTLENKKLQKIEEFILKEIVYV